jgi:hypothetical protein
MSEFQEVPEPDWAKLIPEMKDWNNGAGIDPDGWIQCAGNFQLAVGYTIVFWPRFVEHDEMVLREGFDSESLADWIRHYAGDKSAVESMVNHLHIGDVHSFGRSDGNRERLVHLGRVLKQIYECKLRLQFPERDIVVEFDDSPQAEMPTYVLTFFQRRRD